MESSIDPAFLRDLKQKLKARLDQQKQLIEEMDQVLKEARYQTSFEGLEEYKDIVSTVKRAAMSTGVSLKFDDEEEEGVLIFCANWRDQVEHFTDLLDDADDLLSYEIESEVNTEKETESSVDLMSYSRMSAQKFWITVYIGSDEDEDEYYESVEMEIKEFEGYSDEQLDALKEIYKNDSKVLGLIEEKNHSVLERIIERDHIGIEKPDYPFALSEAVDLFNTRSFEGALDALDNHRFGISQDWDDVAFKIIKEVKRIAKVDFKGRKTFKMQCAKGMKWNDSQRACVKISGAEKAAKRKSLRQAVKTKKSKGLGYLKRVAKKAKKGRMKRNTLGLG